MAVTASDKGIATSEIKVVRADNRKANNTMATMMAPSRKASVTLPMDASMKSAWRNNTFGAANPTGSPCLRSPNAASMAWVSLTVSAAGCFCTLTMTAGTPLYPASPRFMAAANRTLATCSSKMARPSFQATATPCRSSTRLVRPMWRMRNSRLLRSMKPPPAFPAKPRRACSICVNVTPNCAMRAVSGSTRNWRTSPPMGMT